MGFPPEAYLIGAQKAGTTTLAVALDQHPGITLSTPKETHYLTRDWRRGLDWYRQRFAGPPGSIFLDATSSYSAAPVAGTPGSAADMADDPRARAAERLHRLNPDAKLIYLLRDPVRRTYSAYWHEVRAGREQRSFRQAIAENSVYLRAGDYAAQIENYLKYFDINQFLFLLFEDMRQDISATAQRCFAFLGAQPTTFTPRRATAKNRSYQYSRAGSLLVKLFPSQRQLKAVSVVARTVIPRPLHPLVLRIIATDIPPMRDDDRAFLIEYFGERNRRLASLTGLNLDRWQRPLGQAAATRDAEAAGCAAASAAG